VTDKTKTPTGATPLPDVPRATALDKLRDVGIASAAAVPAFLTHLPVAGPFAAILNAALGQPTRKRWEAWAVRIGETVQQLVEERGITPETLADSPAFQNAARRATEAAMKDAHRNKWEMLRSALMNAAPPSSFDEDVQQFLFQLIDELGLTHVAILRAILSPQAEWNASGHQPKEYGIPILDFLKDRLGKGSQDEPDIHLLLDQLAARGLIPANNTLPPWQGSLILFKDLTPMGKRFLAFVSRPSSSDAMTPPPTTPSVKPQ